MGNGDHFVSRRDKLIHRWFQSKQIYTGFISLLHYTDKPPYRTEGQNTKGASMRFSDHEMSAHNLRFKASVQYEDTILLI